MPPVAGSRALRAGLTAAAAVGTAVLAHIVGHGTVDAAGTAWAFLLLVGPAWWLAGRELGWARLALVQLAGQQAAHAALVAGALTGPSVAAHGGSGVLPADLVLYAHLLAAVLNAAWLRLGERRAWAAVGRLARAVLDPAAPTLVATPSRDALRLPAPARRRPDAPFLRYALARRGPPRTV